MEPLIGSFQDLESAEIARGALLAKGISPDAMELQVIADEAGATDGNFASGNGRSVGESPIAIGGVGHYDDNFASPTFSGSCLLLVVAADDNERNLILGELGANARTETGAQ